MHWDWKGMKRKRKAYLTRDGSGDKRAQRDGHRATTTRYSLLLCVLFFSVWCVCLSLFCWRRWRRWWCWYWSLCFLLAFSLSFFLRPPGFSFLFTSPLFSGCLWFSRSSSSCSSASVCSGGGATRDKAGARALAGQCFSLFLSRLLLHSSPVFFFYVLLVRSFFFFSLFLLCEFTLFFLCFPLYFFFLRPFSGFYKAREGLVSLPPEMVGIVEARDHGRIVGIVAMICWIFPCWTGLWQTDEEQ